MLKQYQYTETNGVRTSTKRINKRLEVKGTLDDFVKSLNKKIIPTPLEASLPEGLNGLLFNIKISWDDGFEQAFDELEITYGLNVEKQTSSRKVLRIQ